jgi:hypothetical protein
MQLIKFNTSLGQQVAVNPALIITISPAGFNEKSEPLTAINSSDGSTTTVIGSLDYIVKTLSDL